MPFVKGQIVRTSCVLYSDNNDQTLSLPKHTRGVIHELPSENSGMYSIAVGRNVYDVEVDEVEILPESFSELDEAEKLWAKGVRAWVDGLNNLRQPQAQLLQQALGCFQASIEHSLLTRSHTAIAVGFTKKGLLSNEMFSRRCLFVAVSFVDSDKTKEAMRYFELATSSAAVSNTSSSTTTSTTTSSSSSSSLSLAFIEYCWALEKIGELVKARKVAVKAVQTNAIWQSPWQRPGYVDRSLEARPFWETSRFEWVDLLQRRTPIILHELDSLLSGRDERGRGGVWKAVGGEHRETGKMDGTVVSKGNWRELVLFGTNAQPFLAPNTARILEDLIPDAVDLCAKGGGEIIFSRLDPHTRLAAHCAPTNLRLTAHLGLIVPPLSAGRCEIRVGKAVKKAKTISIAATTITTTTAITTTAKEEEKNAGGWRRWNEGQVMIFDDSFEHEVINDTSLPRIVLLIRFWHPQLNNESVRANALSNSQVAIEQGKILRVCPPLRSSFLDQWAHGDYTSLSTTERVRCPKCKRSASIRFVTTPSVSDDDDGIRAECIACKFISGSSSSSLPSPKSSQLSTKPSFTSSISPTQTAKSSSTTPSVSSNSKTLLTIDSGKKTATTVASTTTKQAVSSEITNNPNNQTPTKTTLVSSASSPIKQTEESSASSSDSLSSPSTIIHVASSVSSTSLTHTAKPKAGKETKDAEQHLSPEILAKLQAAQELIKKSGLPIKLVKMPNSS